MILRIQCTCGKVLLVDSEKSSGSIICDNCNWVHSIPTTPSKTVNSHSKNTTISPVMRILSIVPACLAVLILTAGLLWALSGPLSYGLAGRGTGISGQDEGSGTKYGDGAGAGEASEGTDAAKETTGTPQQASTGGESEKSVTENPSEAPPEPNKPLTPSKPVGFFVAEKIEKPTPPAPPAPASPPGGVAGRKGGGKKPGKVITARGDISFILDWTYSQDRQGRFGRGGPDIDIWIIDPLKQKINTSGGCLGPTPQGGQADVDHRGAYSNGHGPERIFWPEGQAPKGKYIYGVRWFQGTGTVRYRIRVFRGKKLVAVKKGKLSQKAIGINKKLGTIDTNETQKAINEKKSA